MTKPKDKQYMTSVSAYVSSKIQALSFILILIVVAVHSSNTTYSVGTTTTRLTGVFNVFFQKMISQGISRISVPFLFIISGYLFFITITTGSVNEFKNKYKTRFRTLVIPYLFWSLFGLLLFFALQSIPFLKPFFTQSLVRNFSIKQWLHTIFVLPIPAQLWYVRDLIVLVIISPILHYLLKKVPYITLVCFLIFWVLNYRLAPFSPDSLFFFLTGSFLGIRKIPLDSLPKVKYAYLLLLLWLILLGIKTYLSVFHIPAVWGKFLLNKFCILLGIIAVWYCYDAVYTNTDICHKKYYHLFKYSFWLYAVHQPLIHMMKKALYHFMGVSNLNSFIIYLLAIIITVVISLTTGILIRKYFPKLYFISTGGR
jgi:surface polysaccharide O-acyltransferase-like enzyme